MILKDLFKVKEFKKEIEELKNNNASDKKIYSNELSKANSKIKELEEIILNYKQKSFGYITDYIESKEININAFCTNEYKTLFESFVNNESHSETEILNKFNELYNKEKIYFEGIVSCIDFIRTKRNPKISTEKQILKLILTENGRNTLNSYIDAIYSRNSGETVRVGGDNE